MLSDGRLIRTIFSAIDEVNRMLPSEQQLEKSPDTVLFGESGGLDSLGLINLIVAVEQGIEGEYGITLMLVDEANFDQENPFATIGTLSSFVSRLLEGKIK